MMALTSSAVLSIALASSAAAENNDIETYDGKVDAACLALELTAPPLDSLNGNVIAGPPPLM